MKNSSSQRSLIVVFTLTEVKISRKFKCTFTSYFDWLASSTHKLCMTQDYTNIFFPFSQFWENLAFKLNTTRLNFTRQLKILIKVVGCKM
jgi:hypothetical protein